MAEDWRNLLVVRLNCYVAIQLCRKKIIYDHPCDFAVQTISDFQIMLTCSNVVRRDNPGAINVY